MITRRSFGLHAIVAEGLLSRLSFGLIAFVLPLYARGLGLSIAEIGVLTALNSAASVLLKPAMGWVADRFGLKRAFVTSVALRSVVSFLLVVAGAAWQLYPIRVLHGLSAALRDPAANVLIAEQGGEKKVASAFAWYQTAKTAAGSLSKALGGLLLALFAANYSAVFLVAFALSALPLLVVVLFVPDARPHAEEEPAAKAAAPAEEPAPRAAAPRVSVLGVAGFGFLVASTAEMLSNLFPLLATEYGGLTLAQAGAAQAIGSAIAIASGPVFGWLHDHVSEKLVLTTRSAANVLSSAAYLVFPSFAGVTVATGVDAAGKAAFRPAWGAMMARVAGQDRRSRARTVSWMCMGEDAGGVFGPVLAGLLWTGWGVPAVLGARVLLAIVTEVYTVAIAAPKPRPVPAPSLAAAAAAVSTEGCPS
jgi:MFS family permease